MATDHEDLIKPWGVFLLELEREITKEELAKFKLCICDKLTATERDGITEPVKLLEILNDKGLLGEDNTALIREMFKKTQFHEFTKNLDEYELKRKEYVERVSILAGKRDPLFVGRDAYIRNIIDFIHCPQHRGVCCICLWGMAGSGKTKLAAETCAIYKEMKSTAAKLILVDLNKKNSVDDVGMTLLSCVGKPVNINEFHQEMVWKWMRSCSEEHVLLLDNADDLLKPSSLTKDHFQNMLRQLTECPNHNVKVIITSRYAVAFPYLERKRNFREMQVKPLEMGEAVRLLTKSVQQGQEGRLMKKGETPISEQQAKELAEHCGNNPQALRAVASQLRSGKDPNMVLRLLANPMKMEMVLNDQSLWGLGQDATRESVQECRDVLGCLGVMFEDMSSFLKPLLVRLAILPGLFSKKWGLTILSDSDVDDQDHIDELSFRLDDIASTSLLMRESLDIFQAETGRRSDNFYSMHPLVRCLCLMNVDSEPKMRSAFQAGLLSFIRQSFHLLQEFTSYDNEDAAGSLQRIENEKINITQYLELEMRRTFDGKPHPLLKYLPDYHEMLRQSDIGSKSGILAFMERFMFTKERSTFFQLRAEAAQMAQDMPGWVNYQGWYADQQMQLHRFAEAEEAIKEPIMYCQKQPQMQPTLKEGYCQCLYVKSNLLVHKPQDRRYMENWMGKKGAENMQKCIQIRRDVLGDSIVTARTINALGSIYFKGDKFQEALEQHQQALKVLDRITNGHPEIHPDAPFYVMNIATCYHELGYLFSMSMTQKAKGKRYFENAISTYNRGREMLRGVGLDKSSIMASMLKNLAMTYCEMKSYKEALIYADLAASLREDTLGKDHPDVARAHYFLGSLYMSLGDEERDKGKLTIDIEEYMKAKECFDWALEIEFKVGYSRRSVDYDDLKEDIEKLFTKRLSLKTEWQRYKMKIQQHETSQFVPLSALPMNTETGIDSDGSQRKSFGSKEASG